ncbi:sulfurase [Polynucleobacter tropicus]|uniref:Sulfurase n=2 Tax=Polynucleobacter tropicus TaxID=1743174 RepID=A0A6M9PYC0_9BURK|nr:sulfurase [Polynucleobacter tropicus]
MQSLPKAKITLTGIEGDRYANGKGAYSNTTPSKIRHLSLITESGIVIANEWLMAGDEPTFDASQTRRNIVISNMNAEDLNSLVGKTFTLGSLVLKGTELCAPCQRPAKLLNKSDFINAFEGRGGLRAEIMNVGEISVGDILSLQIKDAS